MTSGAVVSRSHRMGFPGAVSAVVSRASSSKLPDSPAIRVSSGCFMRTAMYLGDREGTTRSDAIVDPGDGSVGDDALQVLSAESGKPRMTTAEADRHAIQKSHFEIRMQ
ncbi:hypothetical protein DESC_940040 [Desulfosarcina cetonica]|nr:hypothetical protein DESC_940040 [Desulfosarcina cetonica]